LKVESYGFAAKAIDEIGKLIGGWLKSGANHETQRRPFTSLGTCVKSVPAC
jgi:hypothetical protein